jgi:hypothetical protein
MLLLLHVHESYLPERLTERSPPEQAETHEGAQVTMIREP